MIRKIGLSMVAVVMLSLFATTTAAQASETVTWTGNGLESVTKCVRGVQTPYLHWVLTSGGPPVAGTTAKLFVNGFDVGTMTSNGDQGALQLTISVSRRLLQSGMLEDATAYAVITSGSVGDGAVLTISDGCVCKHALPSS